MILMYHADGWSLKQNARIDHYIHLGEEEKNAMSLLPSNSIVTNEQIQPITASPKRSLESPQRTMGITSKEMAQTDTDAPQPWFRKKWFSFCMLLCLIWIGLLLLAVELAAPPLLIAPQRTQHGQPSSIQHIGTLNSNQRDGYDNDQGRLLCSHE